MGSFEEWWGRTVEGRGSVKWGSAPSYDARTMRKLSTEDLMEVIRSEDTRSVRGLLAHMERRRREEWTARAALLISILALVVAAIHP